MEQKTLAIIKPDAVGRNQIGQIIQTLENQGLSVAAMRMVHLNRVQAEGFYYVHRGKGFFADLTRFMSEAPVVVMVLCGEDAVARWRAVMGATNPAEAAEGTLRRTLAESIERNAVHGSDSSASAEFEIGYFFNALEIVR
jgi:nucleoside-diphosphate kinase